MAEDFGTPGLGSARSPIETIHTPWKVLGSLTTFNGSYTGPDSLVTGRPASDLANSGKYVIEAPFANHLALALGGVGAAGETLSAFIHGWRPADDSGTKWVTQILAELIDCKLGGAVGVGSGVFTSGVRFVHEITTMIDHTYKRSLAFVGGRVGGDGIPHVVIDYTGYALLEIRMTIGTAAARADSAGGMYYVF